MDVVDKKKPRIENRFTADGCDITMDDNGEVYVTFFNQRFGVGMVVKLTVLDRVVSEQVAIVKKKLEIDRKLKEVKT